MENAMKKSSSSWMIIVTLAVLIYQPIADFVAFNYYQTSFSLLRCVSYFLTLLGLSYGVVWIGKRIGGAQRVSHIALFVGMGVMVLFNNYAIESTLQEFFSDSFRFRYVIFADLAMFFVLYLLSGLISKFAAFHYAFLATLFAFATMNVLGAKQQKTHYAEFNVQEYTDMVQVPQTASGSKPNVYYLVPDGYSGPEMFNKIAQTKTSIDAKLTKKGFRVIKNAFSNGSGTMISLPQVYSMNYLFKESEVIKGKKIEELGNLYQQESPVTREFRRRGYKFFRLADGMTGHCFGTEDKCIEQESFFTTQDIVFANRTLIPSTLAHQLWWSKGLIPGKMEMDEFVPLLPQASEGPFFLIGHFALPHNPFRFDKECNSLGYASVFASTQAYFDMKPGRERYNIYEGQTLCAEKKLMTLVEGIQKNDPDAIIIIQADHGTQDYFDPYHLNFEDLTLDNLYQSFNILYAFYGPENFTQQLYDGFSPVNTFRLVFAWLDGEQPRLLPHRAFYGIINKKLMAETGGVYVMREWHDAPVPNKASKA